ncbi:Serine/threonine-protein kinase StkP [Stieleria maiorica]|uniref:Serine/threonine-protein kinase StkP n=1 Tax=Stieleria maiorica TaxID=2795974 RepID=A0A5B9M7R1_9BACT|nr:serine/threonine-protein kinase [Stieleria maiorica]QEF96186.1 Serine/threonine-protein kinase StkP [Stieleria maiorica]
MQIECPHCCAKLQLGKPKPGRYKPKCKRCGEEFLIQVGSEAPPRVRVGKLKPAASSRSRRDAPTVAEPRTADAAQAVGQTVAAEQTVDQTVDQDHSSVSSPAVKISAGTAAQLKDAPSGGPAPSGDESDDKDAATGPPSRLGGYRIIRMLGRGAMGAVYQAKQVSLDRDVALKTIRTRLTENPASLARFTREAYAAAQLAHHNVVQIYDFGEDDGQLYFSMEWIRGGSLGDLVRDKGSLDPKLAATYILQAARGLQFAHRSGMVHRDVKPANLLLSEDGVVKVADLGLVKVPDQIDPESSGEELSYSGLQSGTQVTMQGTAIGTPAYMAPEQSADATAVDHRADIYSLGCSLFYLLAGRSPYAATEISEVIQQHAHAALPDLAEIQPRVPQPLCQIVARAMAKRPSDRYGSLAEMIDDLQSFLGVESLMGFSPSREQADRWEILAERYAKTQLVKRFSGKLFVALAAAAVLITLASPLISLQVFLLGPVMLVTACIVAVVLATTTEQSAIADHVRRWLGTLSWIEIGIASLASLILCLALVVLAAGLWIGAVLGLILGAGIGAGYHFAVTVTAAKAGKPTLEEARRFVRDLRIEGAEEEGLRDFLARYAGAGWQSIYEALFGYDALAEKRRRLSIDVSFDGPTESRSLRDRLCKALDRRANQKRQAADRKKLAQLEQRSLISQGVSAAQAREQSWQMASAIMETAHQTVEQSGKDERVIADVKRKRIKAMLADARSGRYKRPRDRYAALKFAFSGVSRLLAGCLLLAVFAFAAQSVDLFGEEVIRSVRSGDFDLQTVAGAVTTDALGQSTSLWSVGIAGALLCLSAFVSGWRMTPFAVVATIVILFGANLGLPGVGPAPAWIVAAAVGLVIYLPGVVYGERDMR